MPWLVGWIASKRVEKQSLVRSELCSGRASLAKLMIIATSSESICSICSAIFNFDSASRERFRSVACMLAELSTRKINRSSTDRVDCQLGRSKAIITSVMNKSCRNNSRLDRNRCQRLLTCKSSIVRRQRYVLGTSSGCRFSLRKYNARIAGGTSAKAPTASRRAW